MPKKIILITLLLFFSASIKAQTPATTPAPTTPAEYFQLARQQSDIHQPGAKPFRLTATFTSTDEKGKVRTGQYSEIWISKDRWRREISIGDYREASATVSGSYYHFASSPQRDPAAADVLENVTPTVPDLTDSESINKEWSLKTENLGGIQLVRVARMMHFKDRGDLPVTAYFFTPQIGYIRGEQSLIQSAYYNSIHSGLGRIVPFNVTLRFAGKHSTDVKITEYTDPGNPADDAFVIPDATKSGASTDPHETLSTERIQGLIVKKVQPIYPEAARQAHESGDVVLHVIIGRDGHIRDIQIAKATRADFAASAITAVRDYIYKPFMFNGTPVSVGGTITVHYVSRDNRF